MKDHLEDMEVYLGVMEFILGQWRSSEEPYGPSLETWKLALEPCMEPHQNV